MNNTKRYAKMDYALLFTVCALVVFGVVMVYSTSFYKLMVNNRSPEIMLLSSMRYALIGTIVMIVTSLIDYRKFKNLAPFVYLLAIILSIFVLFFGAERLGATRWLTIPHLKISFMPSEFAKIAIIFAFAWLIDGAGRRIKEFRLFFIMIAALALMSLLTVLQRDLSTALLIMLMGLIIMFIGRTNLFYIITASLLGGAASAFYLMMNPYALNRVTIWLNSVKDRQYIFSDDRYQIINSIYAIGSGGLLGKGLGMSEFKFLRLPEAYSDFIFAIICEELGFIAAIALLLSFVFIIYRIFKIAIEAQDRFGFILAAGTAIIIALQVFINIGVVTNLLPTTGITLPFISRGGTSLVILMFLVGVVLNISQNKNTNEVIK